MHDRFRAVGAREMRLNRLEISGFKSFPDRSDLHFDTGVTAIVGPNGCGKSNVVDAITWVLGEQSAKSLRGERMEDIIFSGSDARKPTAAAEVKLRLSGVTVRRADGKPDEVVPASAGDVSLGQMLDEVDEPIIARDVEVGRRLYRSGESEYLIDGEICRLRDVQDLLMDAGLGVKQYAVIEQGKIGQILSSRPAERRNLIEEAAGVTKFKTRRRAAELKLEAAQQNLTRIDDIIFELEKQRGSLKRQAAKARRYRRLREELRRCEKVLFARRFAALSETIETARGRLSDAREQESAAAARVAEIEANLARLRIELAEADAHANAVREQAHAAELDNERRQQQVEFDRHQVASLGQLLTTMVTELDALHGRRDPVRVEIDDRRAARVKAEGEREDASRTLAAEEENYGVALRELETRERQVETARQEVFNGLNAVTTLTHAIERAVEARERIAQETARLDVEQEDLRIEGERVQVDRERATSALRVAQGELESTRAALAAQASSLASARIERDWRVNDVRARERDLAALAARLTSLEELEAARAGYGDAARTLLASADAGVDHRGAVADFLDVDARYERAIEAGLGELLQYIVVDTADAARRGLEHVRARDLGRCGFLVTADLERLEASSATTTPPAPGLVALHDVVRFSGTSAAGIRAVVGRVWIAETSEMAVLGAAHTNDRIVTLQGDVFRGRHLVIGGGKENARGILASKREIKELRDRRAGEHDALNALVAEVSGLDGRIAQAEQAIATLEAELHRHEKAILGFELQAARANDELDRVERRRELMTSERGRANEERAQLERREQESRTAIADLQQTQQTLDARLATAQQAVLGARETQASVARRVAEAKAMHAALVERASAVAQEVRRLEEGATELEARIAARSEEQERLTDRRASLEATIVASLAQLDQDRQAFVAIKQSVADADDRVAVLQTTFQEQEASAKDARRDLETVRAAVGQFDVARATAEADLGHLAESCQEVLQASLDDVAAEVAAMEASGELTAEGSVVSAADPDADDEEEIASPGADAAVEEAARSGEAARMTASDADGESVSTEPAAEAPQRVLSAEDAIAEIKSKLDRLGPVNMMAIEQFDELESRHTFLTTQRKDLVDSIAATGEAIQRIEKTTRERFKDAFEAINRNFQGTFGTLFGGGRAGLILIDETDELESGIDIIAQPPGKRLQNVQLLSGGEKALTAMALMFAIFAYRPSPFCLLDEIDAPLDDANVGRFVDMLRGMQTHTQFILITHHRKTMEIADRLYGVTMEEPGVSKLISLQLN
ncbi:MAG: chromosome segregation protein SMC [Vicinamibacterales bacterium]